MTKSTRIFWLVFLISFVLILSMSCTTMGTSIGSSRGSSIRDEDVARLRSGMSEEEVIKILGSKPQSRLTQPNGNTEMTWSFRSDGTAYSFGKEENRVVSVLFGPDGKMIRISQKTGF